MFFLSRRYLACLYVYVYVAKYIFVMAGGVGKYMCDGDVTLSAGEEVCSCSCICGSSSSSSSSRFWVLSDEHGGLVTYA